MGKLILDLGNSGVAKRKENCVDQVVHIPLVLKIFDHEQSDDKVLDQIKILTDVKSGDQSISIHPSFNSILVAIHLTVIKIFYTEPQMSSSWWR